MSALQAERIHEKKCFLTEHHVHVLATMQKRDILVIQEKKKDALGSAVDLTHYQQGLVPQQKITRRAATALMKSAHPPVPIHLNKNITHFSGLVPKLLGAHEGSDASDDEREHTRSRKRVVQID
jgi:hypothetical protein